MINFEEGETPLSAYSNFMFQITCELSDIFFDDCRLSLKPNRIDYSLKPKIAKNNYLIFEDNKIRLFGFISIEMINTDDIKISFAGTMNSNDPRLNLVSKFVENKSAIISFFYRYCFITSYISDRIDKTISHKMVLCIYEDCLKLKEQNQTTHYLIPFKSKIFDHEDITNRKILENLYNRFSYVLTVQKQNNVYKCSIVRVLSSELDESKSINNIKYDEQELIDTKIIHNKDVLYDFLVKLYYCGEF